MKKNILWIGAIIALAIGTVACDPPQTEDRDETAERGALAEVDEDGPAGIDDGGITAVSDDPELIEKGETLYASQGCVGCHAMDRNGAGPALGGVTERRTASWLAKMIMHPHEMVEQDPVASEMSDNFPAPMLQTNLSPEEAKALIAFLGSQ